MKNAYEVYVNRQWHAVNVWIFRSFSGDRRINDRPYHGPVYYLGTSRVYRPSSRSDNPWPQGEAA